VLSVDRKDYKRHIVTTLFAALDVLEGKVIGQCMKRHRHQEFIRFLNVIDARVAKKQTVHVIIDNYAAHKHSKVLEWIENHPRFVFPLHSDVSLLAERRREFFCETHEKAPSLQKLKDAIHRFLDDPMQTQSPLRGPDPPTKLSPPSSEGAKC
jgi:hypothetical protein